jgi:hypothetical protein
MHMCPLKSRHTFRVCASSYHLVRIFVFIQGASHRIHNLIGSRDADEPMIASDNQNTCAKEHLRASDTSILKFDIQLCSGHAEAVAQSARDQQIMN